MSDDRKSALDFVLDHQACRRSDFEAEMIRKARDELDGLRAALADAEGKIAEAEDEAAYAEERFEAGRAAGRADVGKYSNAIGRIESLVGIAGARPLDETVEAVKKALADAEAPRVRAVRARRGGLAARQLPSAGLARPERRPPREGGAMKELPILFSGEMVRAILAGRKTQTRRLVKPMAGEQSQWLTVDAIGGVPHGEMKCGGWQMHHPKAGQRQEWSPGKFIDIAPDSPLGWIRSPFGEAGDRLWVRETFSPRGKHGEEAAITEAAFAVLVDGAQVYRDGSAFAALESYAPGAFDDMRFRPSIHMPRWASRITLEVTGVHVERLHDITEEDARAEGVTPETDIPPGFLNSHGDPTTCRGAFAMLWDRINAKRAPWASNPWVWVVGFRRLS